MSVYLRMRKTVDIITSPAVKRSPSRKGLSPRLFESAFPDVKNDRPGLEKDETVLFEHRHSAERLQGSVVGLILISHFQETGAVRQSRFLQPSGREGRAPAREQNRGPIRKLKL
jgi:hypothetical protein